MELERASRIPLLKRNIIFVGAICHLCPPSQPLRRSLGRPSNFHNPIAQMEPSTESKAVGDDAKSTDQDERQYLEGLRLAIVLGSVILVSFLVLLDMSILGTASQQ